MALSTLEKYSLSSDKHAYTSEQCIIHFYWGPDDSLIRPEMD